MEYSKLIDELLNELSYRVGIVDLKNKTHQSVISEILTEWGEYEAKSIILDFLNEAGKTPEKNKPKSETEGEDANYTHIGKGIYVKKGDEEKDSAQKYKKDDTGSLKPISDDEYNKEKGEQGKDGEQAAQNTPQNKTDNPAGQPGEEAQPETGTSLKDPTYQDIVKKEKEISDELTSQKNGNTTQTKLKSLDTNELANIDSTKVKKQILMTQSEAEQSQEGVGLGTAESRTGECVTVYAGQQIQKLLQNGKSYDEARAEVESELLNISKDKDSVLTKEWVKSGLSVFDYLHDTIGFDNIENFAWDTPEGNKVVGSEGHGTSADMFIKTEDGRAVGISLKKDFKVFIVNGGYGKAMKEFENKIGVTLPESCQSANYIERRTNEYDNGKQTIKSNRKDFEEVASKFLNDEEYFNSVFGPKAQSYEKRKRYIEKKLNISNWKDATPEQMVDILINENQKSTGDDLKFFAAFNKENSIKEKYGIYTKMRSLDNEMTENIFEFFQSNDSAKNKYKEKIIEDTHILDTLFPNPPLNDFKTIFGTDPAVEMTRAAVGSIFGVSELMKNYESAESDDEKEAIKKQIETQIKNKLIITKKKGNPVIAINLDGPPQSELPLYKLGVRTRGIGNAQTLEVSQETFGSLALKNGNTIIENWDDKDRRTVVEQESKDIINMFDDEEFDVSDLTPAELQDLQERVTQLEKWYPKSPSLKKIKSYNI